MQKNQSSTHRVTKGHQSQTKRTEQTKQPGLPKPAPKGAVASSSSSVGNQTTIVAKAKKGKVQDDPLTEAIKSQWKSIEYLKQRRAQILLKIETKKGQVYAAERYCDDAKSIYQTALKKLREAGPGDDLTSLQGDVSHANSLISGEFWKLKLKRDELKNVESELEEFDAKIYTEIESMKSKLVEKGGVLPPMSEVRNLAYKLEN